MSERLIRLLRIIILIQANPGITAKQLAERCETTERTIYRDLEVLSAAHIPISNSGYGKGYEYLGNFSIYPTNFTNEEAIAFGLLPKVIEQSSHLLPQSFNTAYEKVMASHHKEKKDFSNTLQNMISIIQLGTPAFGQQANDHLYPVIEAILHQESIEIIYHTQSRNVQTTRKIDPYYLIPRDNQFYLIAFCHGANEMRTFRLSRIKEVNSTGQSYEKQDFDIQDYFNETWSIIKGNQSIPFKIRFHSNVARYIKEEELFVRPKLTDEPDGSLLFEVTLNDDTEFLQWLMKYGPNAEILEPVAYREKMKETLQRWMSIYS
ncbi:helix-turn-helix transcriptional regulator [Bacillus alkalicellulosilyticus]|uniref:helix-turn-helix transcriptional regulator n=1 Tax=Alkalihalobacterium alkalicellulosilyticum TaxID=1912214 RepID=UPI000998B049|nr:transcriptional regulator [Bacillus alkalicellulosilyticus]